MPKLNNHIEKRAEQEMKEILTPWQQLKEDDKDSQEKIQKEELCSCNKKIVKSSN